VLLNAADALHGSYSAAFHVSQDALNFMKNDIQKDLAQHSAQATTQQAVILYFIMRDSSISNQQIDAGCSCIDLMTVDGSCLSIHVKRVSGSMTSVDSPPMEIALLCSSVHLLCRLHEAVLTRLKPVIARETRNGQMRAYELQKATEKLQNLQEKIVALEDAISMRQGRLNGLELKVKLWSLYEELRRVVLLI